MCGRFGATFQYRDLKRAWNLQGDFSFYPRYNIAPSQEVPVIVRQGSVNQLKPMRWGLIPEWSDDKTIAQRMINARAETLLDKPSFKNLVAEKRCLIPADGFYEWRRDGNARVPMWICLKNREPFTFPALWDCWIDRDTGKALYTFTIITTQPNDLMRPIHNRMPVIYDPAMGQQWLERSFAHSPLRLKSALQPLRSSQMQAYEVSSLVNSPENDSSECIRPISQSEKKEQLRLL